ncbi:MAG: phospholipase [Beijerinckiaceae bacterium]|nr:MAG: phospholipase [Beijerinckiaceae bacterium]
MIRSSRRNILKSMAAGSLVLTASRFPVRAAPAGADLQGLRGKIDHIVVIYQENRSFDHYFGAYQNPNGAKVDNLLDVRGNLSSRFAGLQTNPAGVPYSTLPAPIDIPGFQHALLPNQPFHLAPYISAAENVPWDPSHHFFRMFAQINGGRMDRFVALALQKKLPPHHAFTEANRTETIFAESKPSGAVLGYYTRADIPNYHRLADEYVLFDHFFQAMSGGSTGNALYLVAGRSAVSTKVPQNQMGDMAKAVFDKPYDDKGILINDLPPVNGPTEISTAHLKLAPAPYEQAYPNIGERLDAAGLTWAWYNESWNAVKSWALKTAFGPGDGSAVIDTIDMYVPHHNPFQYYPSWAANVKAGHMRDSEDFFADVKAGKLPSVSFLKATGVHDEHPADSAPQWGEAWVMRILKALGESRLWERTAVVITYDEGGGFWDHVAPPRPDAYGCGTRIPALLISPYARRGYVDHKVADTTSILAMIEARFGLEPLQARDANAYALLDGLDFSQRPRMANFD